MPFAQAVAIIILERSFKTRSPMMPRSQNRRFLYHHRLEPRWRLDPNRCWWCGPVAAPRLVCVTEALRALNCCCVLVVNTAATFKSTAESGGPTLHGIATAVASVSSPSFGDRCPIRPHRCWCSRRTYHCRYRDALGLCGCRRIRHAIVVVIGI